ncbi:hypothetical protein [Actinoplanes subglobosus]|uniref:Tetratricopeptide repeat protein n=1 Tax=Actinoplanes subglobosus TaxID=1547892 RepID=A0ABV8IPD6_9ACTN
MPHPPVSGHAEPVPGHSGRAADALVRAIAARTAARDPAGAARLRLDLARLLRDTGRWDDATESAERARRDLDRAGLTDDATAARWLLIELYEHRRDHQAEIGALFGALLAAPRLPASVPSRAVLLEQSVRYPGHRDPAVPLLEAADLHRDAGDTAAETRVTLEALSRATGTPPQAAELVSRVDTLLGEDVSPSLRAELCRLEGLLGRREQALARARRDPVGHGDLRTREGFLLLELGRYAEAEAVARPWAGREDDEWFWEAGLIVVRSLRARDREADAVAFLAGHGLELTDLDDVLLD